MKLASNGLIMAVVGFFNWIVRHSLIVVVLHGGVAALEVVILLLYYVYGNRIVVDHSLVDCVCLRVILASGLPPEFEAVLVQFEHVHLSIQFKISGS